jgi:hypothetical protein
MKDKTFGIWEIETEGDCEGRSIETLEIEEGYIDEIAFKLANRAMYELHFKKINIHSLKDKHNTKNSIPISIEGYSSLNEYKKLFKNRNVIVSDDGGYDSVRLTAIDCFVKNNIIRKKEKIIKIIKLMKKYDITLSMIEKNFKK